VSKVVSKKHIATIFKVQLKAKQEPKEKLTAIVEEGRSRPNSIKHGI
jgi:hypothetical protein